MRRAVPSLLLLLAATAPAMPNGARLEQRQRAELEATDEIILYRTNPGDTLQGLAKRWFVNPEDWRRAMALNKIKDPGAIPAGTTLRLRSGWLKTTPISAELAAFRGDVRVVRKTSALPVMKGMELAEGDILETGPNGFATLSLPDRSQVSLPSASRIRLARLRQVPMSDSIDRRFTLEQGRSEARVTPMANPASRFLITTPVAVAAVRGTQYVVSYTPAEMKALTAVTEGKVAVLRKGGIEDVLLRAGFGNITTGNGTSRPITLLPAPAVETPERVQDAEQVSFRIRPVAGAVRYRVEIATDAGFVDRVASVDIEGTVARFEGVPDGDYHVRAMALDAMGLSGQPTDPVTFQRSWVGNQQAAAARELAERREQIAELGTEQSDFSWFDRGAGQGELRLAGSRPRGWQAEMPATAAIRCSRQMIPANSASAASAVAVVAVVAASAAALAQASAVAAMAAMVAMAAASAVAPAAAMAAVAVSAGEPVVVASGAVASGVAAASAAEPVAMVVRAALPIQVTRAPAAWTRATRAPATRTPATRTPATRTPATRARATWAPATWAPAARARATPTPTQAPATSGLAAGPAAGPRGRVSVLVAPDSTLIPLCRVGRGTAPAPAR